MEQRAVLYDPDVIAVRASFSAALKRLCPPLVDAGQNLLDRMTSSSWTLEWYLPRWLGEAFGLQVGVSRALMLSNAFGLTYVRLQDGLVDGDLEPESRESAIPLASALYHLWMLEYVRLFEGRSLFWGYLERFMGQWLQATLESNRPSPVAFSRYEHEHFLHLANRGAPLKICCVEACLLAGREELVAPLTEALDDLLIATVLLDHAQDWAEDLTSGRYNAFVAFASAAPQVQHQQETNRLAVLREIYLGDAARPYFSLARRHIQTANEVVRAMDVPGLEAYLHWIENQTAGYGQRLAAEARARLRAVTEQLLGRTVTPDQGGIPEEGR